MNLRTKITKLLDQYDHVTVFTQSHELVRSYLTREPGRWSVQVNAIYWQSFLDGYGQKFNLLGPKAMGEVGLDCPGTRLTFTKNPFRPILPNSCALIDTFDFPSIEMHDVYPPLTFISKHTDKPIAIIPANQFTFRKLRDQLVLQNIQHGVNEANSLTLFNKLQYIHGYYAVAMYKYAIVPSLMLFHDVKKIVLIGQKSHQAYKIDRCEAVMHTLAQTPNSAITFEWLAMQTAIFPRHLLDTLEFLTMMGCIKEIHPDNEVIVIEKRGDAPDDLQFHSIPDGSWYVRQLASHLKIGRDEVFPLLKKWEGKGLVFSYAPNSKNVLWTIKEPFDRDKYHSMIERLDLNRQWLGELITGGAQWLNRHLAQKAERHAKQYRMAFYIGEETFSPTATNLSDMVPLQLVPDPSNHEDQ